MVYFSERSEIENIVLHHPLVNILSVDLEDWPQSTLDRSLPITSRVVSNTHRLLDLFAQYKTKATFFVLGLVAEAYPELVREVANAGHEIATHGFSHELVFNLSPSEFSADVARSVRLIEDITGQKVVGYRAPDFSITNKSLWALDILAEQGIKYDSSIFPIKGSRYGIPSSPRFPYRIKEGMQEVPLSTIRLGKTNIPVCGGGYFRLMPYSLTKQVIKHLNNIGKPAVIYLHPYELDPEEFKSIKANIPHKLRLSQGLNRGKTESKLRTLLADFDFMPIKEAITLK